MKKLLIFATCVVLLVGCAASQQAVITPRPQEVIIRIEGEKATTVSTGISRSMQIPYEEPQFPTGTTVIGDRVYYLIWGYINVLENQNLWKVFQVAKHKGLFKVWIYINSGGGNAFDGLAMADLILRAKREGLEVITEASGIVASAAVPIFVVGQQRIASEGTVFMIHPGKLWKFFAEEGKEDLLAQQKMMEIEEERYNKLLAQHSKLSFDEVCAKVAKTTWFTAKQAQEWGVVDQIQ